MARVKQHIVTVPITSRHPNTCYSRTDIALDSNVEIMEGVGLGDLIDMVLAGDRQIAEETVRKHVKSQ